MKCQRIQIWTDVLMKLIILKDVKDLTRTQCLRSRDSFAVNMT